MPDPPPGKLRAFLDSNVLLSAFAADGVPARIWHRAEDGAFDPVVSEQVMEEFEEHEPRVIGFPSAKLARTLNLIRGLCEVVETPTDVHRVCRDTDDDAILAAAVEAKVNVLVTGDKDLLVLGTHEGVEIIRPAEFLKRIGREKPA